MLMVPHHDRWLRENIALPISARILFDVVVDVAALDLAPLLEKLLRPQIHALEEVTASASRVN